MAGRGRWNVLNPSEEGLVLRGQKHVAGVGD
jgi:hypothetical protein